MSSNRIIEGEGSGPVPGADRDLLRRRFLLNSGAGLGWVALQWLLQSEIVRAAVPGASSMEPKPPHSTPKVKRVVQVFALGGMSHLDTFDYKPEVGRRDGGPFEMQTFFGQAGNLFGSPFEFRRHGESGLWVSDLLPHLAGCADKLTVIRSMTAKSANHMPAIAQMNTGFVLNGFPSMGAWVSYGLGTENQDLPAYVVLPDPRSLPWAGTLNWSSAFLPATYQGTAFRTSGEVVPDLETPGATSPAARKARMDWLDTMNRRYQEEHPGDSTLEARVRSYELAARMQLSVPEAVDVGRESEAVRRLYGLDGKHTGRLAKNCLLARRLLERGVRFVQVFHGGPAKSWDAHRDLVGNHRELAREYDQPVAALLKDLDARGLLEDTLVMGLTEFGRTPVAQGHGKKGRDHFPDVFTCWLAGGGLRPGFAYGSSDELGSRPAENPTTIYDLHATCLHLLGLDHKRLSFYHNGIQRRLTDVHGHVVKGILS